MTTFTLQGTTFEVTEKSRDFLESYVKRMRSYIDARDISENYLDDILDRIVEKLETLEKSKKLTKDVEIIKIVNDIGEPEDIFTEWVKSKEEKPAPKKPPAEKYLKKDLENGIIFWVCSGMGVYFGMNALWFRLIFICAALFFWTGVLVYIVLALLLPKADNNSSSPIVVEWKGLINHLSGFVAYGFRGVFRIVLAVIFALIGFGALMLFIGGSMVSGFIIAWGVTISNQIIPAVIPDALKIWVPLLTIVLLLISVTLFSAVFGKTLLGKTGWIGLFTLFAISVISITSGGFQIFKEYTWSAYKASEVNYDFSGTTLNVNNIIQEFRDDSLEVPIWTQVRIYPEANKTNITVRTTEYLQTKDAITSEKIFASMVPIVQSYTGWILKLERGSGSYFKDIVPYAFPRRRIEVIIPEGTTLVGQYEYMNDWEDTGRRYRY